MHTARDVLTPDALGLLESIVRQGSFAAAARERGMVPSALTYRIRQIEDALDVLLFDRTSRSARLTDAGAELLREGTRLLHDLDAVANRVRRVATGWESRFSIAVDGVVAPATVLELCERFFTQRPPTRLSLLSESLSGTLEALTSGRADLAIGVVVSASTTVGLHRLPLGSVRHVFAVAPHHPLAQVPEPLGDDVVREHRAVAVADSATRAESLSIGLLPGQDVFTVDSMPAKLEAQLRGLGVGFLPACLAQPYIDTGRLIEKRVERPEHQVQFCYAWRRAGRGGTGKALQWWLTQLESPLVRRALLGDRNAR